VIDERVIGEAAPTLTVRRGGAVLLLGAEVLASSGASAIVRAALAEDDLVARDPSALPAGPE
jgi:hypothetical protein